MSVYSKNAYDKDKPNDAWFKIFQFIEPGSRILDIGCSSGKLGAALKKEKDVHVIGLDIDKADVALAKKNLDEAYIANVEQDDLSQFGTFDYIVMADVIEHLLDPVAALQEVKKLLKPSGQLVFSIPNMANVTTRLDLLEGKFAYKEFGLLDKTHLHFYDQNEVDRIFRDAGMVIKQTDCTLRPIPKDILTHELKQIGIELTKQLEDLLNSDEAIIYQFIGLAQPGKPKTLVPKSTTHLDVISVFIEELRASYDTQIASKTEEIHHLAQQVRDLDSELSGILNSRSWKAVQKAQSIKRKLSPRK